MGELGRIPAGDLDPAVDAETTDRVSEEFRSTLGAVKQDEFELGPVERQNQTGHSPAAAQIAPALTRRRIGGVAVGPGMPDMELEFAGSEEPVSLTAREHLQEPFVVGVHGENAP